MPERGHNRLSLTLTSELQVALNKFSGNRNQGTLTSALWIITKALKSELDEINPQAYDKHIKQYSKTIAEQVRIKQRKNKLKEQKEKYQAEYMQKKEQLTNLNRLEKELYEQFIDIGEEFKKKYEPYQRDSKEGREELKKLRQPTLDKMDELRNKRFKIVEYLNQFSDSLIPPEPPIKNQ